MQNGLKDGFTGSLVKGRRPRQKKTVMTPAGLAPAPVAVFTCSREARRLIESGLKAAHRSLSGPHGVQRLMFACDRARSTKNGPALPSRTA